jgi:predicted ester cyclase
MWRAAFPDSVVTIEDIIAGADRVVVRSTVRATRTGAFGGQPPNGRRVHTRANNIYRLRSGRIVERWGINTPLVEENAVS